MVYEALDASILQGTTVNVFIRDQDIKRVAWEEWATTGQTWGSLRGSFGFLKSSSTLA
jgi:hypothetical protein